MGFPFMVSRRGALMNIKFLDYHKKVLSQFGQDGVIEKIFKLIKPINKYFVEFGSCGGDDGQGNTAHMRSYGFDGLLMDGRVVPYGVENTKKYPVKIEFVKVENVVDLFIKYEVPKDLDFLSIDIDGNDYWVLKEILTCYKPRVICVEANYNIPLKKNIVQRYNPDFIWEGGGRFGASYRALYGLGVKNEYSLVAICGCDMIFVMNEIIPEDLIIENINDVEKLVSIIIPDKDLIAALKDMFCWSEWIDLDKK